jgi:hypothetical protein
VITRRVSALLAGVALAGLAGGGAMIFSALTATASGFTGPFGGPYGGRCGVNQSCAALAYEATRTDGESGFTCTGTGVCLDLGPGSLNQIGTNASGHILLGPVASNTIVKIGDTTTLTGNGDWTNVNGVFDLQFNAYMTNTQTKPVLVDDAQGFRIAPKAIAGLPQCGVDVQEGTFWPVLAAGGVATGLCLCTSDGAGTPAYAWARINLQAGTFTTGTATTCAP